MTKPVSKTRKWWRERNKRRNERYRNDPAYRDQVNKMNRDHYRKTEGASLRAPMSLSEVAKIGTVRKLESGASRKTYSIQEMAEALGGYHGGVFYRWLRTSRFPQPDIPVTEKGRPPYKVYSAEATKALVKVFSDHQKVKAYFHKSDTDTIQKLFDVMGQKV